MKNGISFTLLHMSFILRCLFDDHGFIFCFRSRSDSFGTYGTLDKYDTFWIVVATEEIATRLSTIEPQAVR